MSEPVAAAWHRGLAEQDVAQQLIGREPRHLAGRDRSHRSRSPRESCRELSVFLADVEAARGKLPLHRPDEQRRRAIGDFEGGRSVLTGGSFSSTRKAARSPRRIRKAARTQPRLGRWRDLNRGVRRRLPVGLGGARSRKLGRARALQVLQIERVIDDHAGQADKSQEQESREHDIHPD